MSVVQAIGALSCAGRALGKFFSMILLRRVLDWGWCLTLLTVLHSMRSATRMETLHECTQWDWNEWYCPISDLSEVIASKNRGSFRLFFHFEHANMAIIWSQHLHLYSCRSSDSLFYLFSLLFCSTDGSNWESVLTLALQQTDHRETGSCWPKTDSCNSVSLLWIRYLGNMGEHKVFPSLRRMPKYCGNSLLVGFLSS